MKLPAMLLSLYLLSGYNAVPLTSQVEIPVKVAEGIRSDYLNRAKSTADRPSISIQTEQAFAVDRSAKTFAILPFTYIPKNLDLPRQCVVRILSNPEYNLIQDLSLPEEMRNILPCRGVIAVGFRDLNLDRYQDILLLYDFHTSGNPDLKLYPAVFVFDEESEKFIWNEKASEKAARNDVRTIKGMMWNLQR